MNEADTIVINVHRWLTTPGVAEPRPFTPEDFDIYVARIFGDTSHIDKRDDMREFVRESCEV